ncbi:MAG: hypothetical protein EXR07_17800 [Acetobacteraceae bacterium]|nr:hypothetical protein [Acetobacteraceae bacterium]
MVRNRSYLTVGKWAFAWPAISACLLFAPSAWAQPAGTALVIGNAAYTSLPPLPACGRSGTAVSASLKTSGFEIVERLDATIGEIDAGLSEFSRRLAGSSAASFVYVCGYGAGFNGRVFVLPVNTQAARPSDVLTQGIMMKTFLDTVARGGEAPAVAAFDIVPQPGSPPLTGLDTLAATKVTPGLGLIAVSSVPAGDGLTPFAAALTGVFADPVVRSDGLLTNVDNRLWGSAAIIAIMRLPSFPGYLTGAPRLPVARPAQAVTVVLPDENKMTEKDRREVQSALARLGYYKGPINGRFDADTRTAINIFQIRIGSGMTGRLTSAQASQLVGAGP